MTHIRQHGVRRALAVAGAAALIPGLLSACGSSGAKPGGGGSAPATGASTVAGTSVTVHVKNFAFSPASLTVHTGTKVTWEFDDSVDHNATAKDKSFASPNLSGSKTFSFTFNTPGSYPYLCTIHQYMTGTVTVVK